MTTARKTRDARRKLLKSLVAGGGVMASGKILPDHWSAPVVESVVLPAHAQTTSGPIDGVFLAEPTFVNLDDTAEPDSILDLFAEPAHAGLSTPIPKVCTNAISSILFSVSGNSANVCVKLFGGETESQESTAVDPDARTLADVFFDEFSLNMSSLRFDAGGNAIIGDSNCGPFVATRTNEIYTCDDGIFNLTTDISLSSPYLVS